MGVFWITVLLWNLPLSSVLSLSCEKDKQYGWPYESQKRCCSKCQPGEYMKRRCLDDTTDTVCEKCSRERYNEGYHIESRCMDCTPPCGPNEKETSPCTTMQNRVCECKQGYKRSNPDSDCEEEKREVTTTVTTTFTTTVTDAANQPSKPVTKPKTTPSKDSYVSDPVLLPVVLTVCMIILLLIIATKLKKMEPFGCCLIDDSASSKDTQSTEEEALPIQEVCSHLQEEWRKDGLESIISISK